MDPIAITIWSVYALVFACIVSFYHRVMRLLSTAGSGSEN